ncbi:MAG: DUF3047 domain-containing protein [bacterium]|nr:DUF3047 domain-containing protein [bacterium]
MHVIDGGYWRCRANTYIKQVGSWLTLMVIMGVGIGWATPKSHVLRFSDTPVIKPPASKDYFTLTKPIPTNSDSPRQAADHWLQRNGWKQLWPLLVPAGRKHLTFAGPPTQRYLRLNADKSFYIWARRTEVDPYQLPYLEISWGVERFPQGAALDLYGRNDRSIAVMISFGPKVPSSGLRPSIPRALAFFWGATEKVGGLYSCIKPRQGPSNVRVMHCKYPHVKYIALRSGGAGGVHTDRVNLIEYFQRYFPQYWQKHHRVPPVVAVSFEARSDKTASLSIARLYAIAFTASANGRVAVPVQEGK